MANNILYISDGDYGTPSGYILPLVQGQFGQTIPLEIRDLAENVVNLTGYSTITGHKRKGGDVTAIVGTFTLSGSPTVAPQISWAIDEDDTGDYGNFALFLEITNGTITYTTHPVSLSIVRDPAVNATPAAGLVGVTTAQSALLSVIQGLTGLVKMAAGSATGVVIQSFMQTFLTSATALAARANLLPSYTSNASKVLAVNSGATDVEWVTGGGGAVDVSSITTTTGNVTEMLNVKAGGGLQYRTVAQVLADLRDSGALAVADIGTLVQAYSAKTAAIAALAWAANSIILLTGTATASVQALASHVVTFLQSANAAAARTAIGAGTGNGDVTGPASSTDNAIVRFDSTTGKAVQNSATTIDDNGNITISGSAGTTSRSLNFVGSTQTLLAYIDVTSGVFRFAGITNTAIYADNAEVMRVANTGRVGIGRTSPEGKLHVYDSGGGFMQVYKSGVVGSATAVLPDAAGDVTLCLSGTFTVSDGAGNTAGGVITKTVPGGTFNLYDDGGTNTCQLQISAGGAVTVIRTAGSRTYTVNLNLNWM